MSNTEIFTDGWIYGKLPEIAERKKLDCSSLSTMGSCFSRNLIRWMKHYELTEREQPWDILYNPFSIQKEVERLFAPVNWEDNVLTELSSDGQTRYRDPWRTWHVFPSVGELRDANKAFDEKTKQFVSSSTGFIITLGISEVWNPVGQKSAVLNQVPIGSMRVDRNAWESRFASVSEVSEFLNTTVDTIHKNLGANLPIIFTLSPVPLRFTASGFSIREANNISKATLLVALRELSTSRTGVEYFPSYEIVQALTEQDPKMVWQEDGRHVTAKAIDLVSRRFLATHGVEEVPGQNAEMFWVPLVNKEGKVGGKLYLDGSIEFGEVGKADE